MGLFPQPLLAVGKKSELLLIQQLPFKVAIPKKKKVPIQTSWWLNQPIWKNMKKYARQIESFPQFIGVKIPKNPWNHQPIQAFRLPPSWGAIQLVTSQRAWDEAQGSLFYSSVDKKCIPQYHSNLCMLKIACHHSTWIFLGKKTHPHPLVSILKPKKNEKIIRWRKIKILEVVNIKKLFFQLIFLFKRWEGRFDRFAWLDGLQKTPQHFSIRHHRRWRSRCLKDQLVSPMFKGCRWTHGVT